MNTYIPHITMNLSSIANAVNIINAHDSKSYPVPNSIDHRTIGNLFKAINADYSTVPGNVVAYRNAINSAFQVLDDLFTIPTFSGTIADQTGADGAAFSVDVASYFTGASIVYTSTGTALPGTVTLSSSTGALGGVYPSAGTTTGHIITGTNTLGADVTNAFDITAT